MNAASVDYLISDINSLIQPLFYNSNMTISKKLILSMVALTACILITTLSLARWGFELGFAEFIDGLERERLSRIAEQVKNEYINANNSWVFIQESSQEVSVLLGANKTQRRGPPRRRPPERRHTPPGSSLPDTSPQSTPFKANANQNQARPNVRPPPQFRTANPITQLLDVSKNILMSSDANGILERRKQDGKDLGIEIEVPILTDDKPIGYLRSYTPAPSGDSLQTQFNKQQLQASLLIGFICLLVTFALAYFISQMFVRPIKLLNSGVTKLTQGKYQLALPNKGNDELAQLMRNTEKLANTLEQARSQKNRWFADISHELRTPLTILVGEIEAMRAGIREFDTKQLDSIEQEVSLLHRLVDDLYQLSLSDMGALKYEFNKCNISVLVLNNILSFTTQFEEKNIYLETDIEDKIYHFIDSQRFEQMLNNLLSNSLKYTDKGGKIKVSLSQINNTITLSVEDSYPGVPEEECKQLFETLYQRNTSRNRNNSGAGLGLAICKNIAKSHQGHISAEPSALGGIKVIIVFTREAGHS